MELALCGDRTVRRCRRSRRLLAADDRGLRLKLALDAGTGDATIADGSTGDAGFVQASHLPFPSIVYSGAPLLLAPKVVSIVFKSDPFVTSLEEFGAGITSTTTWWPTVISEYCDGDGGCVGKGPAGVSAEIDASAPAAVYNPSLGPGDAGGAVNIQTFINDLIAAGTVPAPDRAQSYALYLPTTTDFNGGGSGCDQGFEGYHSQATTRTRPRSTRSTSSARGR